MILLDLDTGDNITIEGSAVELAGNRVMITSQQLMDGRRYNVSVLASNRGGSAMSYALISESRFFINVISNCIFSNRH